VGQFANLTSPLANDKLIAVSGVTKYLVQGAYSRIG
jgi:hypothetical protein